VFQKKGSERFMDVKNAKIMVNGQLKRYRLERNSEFMGELFSASSIAVDGCISAIGGLIYMISSRFDDLLGSITIGVTAIGECVWNAHLVDEAREKTSETRKKIGILKAIKYEIKNGVNRFEHTNPEEFQGVLQDMYEEKPRDNVR
jgi:hypothetical protein